MKLIYKVLFFVLFIFSVPFFFNATLGSIKENEASEVQANLKLLENNQILVSFLPIEIGEATLIQLSNNNFYLIDTGHTKSSNQLIELLKDHGVIRLEGLILTNFEKEHTGGLTDVLNHFAVDTIYVPDLTAKSFKISNGAIKTIKVNDELELSSDLKIKVMAPSEPLSLSPQANSLVFQLIHKEIHFLFTSAITGETEKRLVEKYNLDSEILKVSDFGSNISSIPIFLEEVDPQVAIIFSSYWDLYQLNEEVLERLNETWTDVYIIEKNGEVQIISDGINYQVTLLNDYEE